MATLKDVAKKAGLTVSTVSRILNNRGYISDDARKRVYDAIKELDYHPNEVARALQNKRSKIIALIVPHVKHPYFSSVISEIEAQAFMKGYRLLIFNSRGREEKEKEILDICKENRVAGIILCSGTVNVRLFEDIGVPLITYERYIDGSTASVECDNINGGELAARHLIGLGCRKIIMINGKSSTVSMPADLRWVGFTRICKAEGISYIEIAAEPEDFNSMDYLEKIRNSFSDHPDVDGVFASSDVIASQVIQICREIGKKIPEDIKLVGFDNTKIASLTTPQITTIHQPVDDMAKLAVGLLTDSIEGMTVPERSILPVSLIVRGSTDKDLL